jgi:excisionase family DNA binding protein
MAQLEGLLQRARDPEAPTFMTDEWVNVVEAARLLDVSTKTIYRQLWAGTLPCRAVRIGRLWRICLADLEAMR